MQALSSMTLQVGKKFFIEKMFFKQLGYKKHIRGYIKKDDDGRFHIVHSGMANWTLHYDVNTSGGRHMTMPSEYKLPAEFKRLVQELNKLPNLKKYAKNFRKNKTKEKPKIKKRSASRQFKI